jgi:hypothetical protein
MTTKTLHFIYNVDATPVALVKDFVHRLVDPETYPCKLCDITYGRFVKKPSWQLFLWSLPVQSAFYTKTGFIKKFPRSRHREFPAVLAESDSGHFTVFISSHELASIPSLEALESEVRSRLEQRGSADVPSGARAGASAAPPRRKHRA